APKPECGEPVNLRKVMELDSVGVYTDLFFSFATESYLLGLGARAGFSRTYVFGTHEGCGWTHLVQKHGVSAKQEPRHGVVFSKLSLPACASDERSPRTLFVPARMKGSL